MIKVYIWLIEDSQNPIECFNLKSWPSCLSYFREYFGHVSILVELKNKESQYLSFWPNKKSIIQNPLYMDSIFLESYQKDINDNNMGKEANHIIEISSLNEEKIYKFCKDQRQKNHKYNILYKNCSTFVAKALYNGTPMQNEDYLLFKKKSFPCKEDNICNGASVGIDILDKKNKEWSAINQEDLVWTPKKTYSYAKDIDNSDKPLSLSYHYYPGVYNPGYPERYNPGYPERYNPEGFPFPGVPVPPQNFNPMS